MLLLPAALTAQQPVEVAKVVKRAVERKTPLPGEFLPFQTVGIHAKVTGFVERVEVDRGSLVTKGQLLAVLSAPELKTQTAEAQAKVHSAQAQRAEAAAKLIAAQGTYERLKAAARTPGVVAGNELVLAEQAVQAVQAQMHAVESSVSAAESAVKALQDMEAYLRITAPFDGVITERNVHPGALAGPTGERSLTPMFRLEQNTRLRLVVAVPEVDIAGIPLRAHVPFTVPSYPGRNFTGVVSRLAHSMDPKTRSMAVELDVANPGMTLAPGMYPTVMWPVKSTQASLLAPATSVVTTTEKTFVIRVRNGVAEWIPVRKGPPAGQDLVEVFGPLEAGDTIVKRASDELREGARVTVKAP